MVRPVLALLALLPAALAQSTSAGCGKSVPSASIDSTKGINITSSSVTRRFYVHLPADYDPSKEYPTIFGFHGAPGIGPYFEADTRFSAKRWGAGRIQVYPDALNGIWATGTLGNMTTPVDQDLRFISDILDYLRDNYCIDNERIYATGISNGGGFTNRIACDPTVGANFAAFAPSSGAYTGFEPGANATCNPYKTPIPIISIHGGNDTTIPYEGRNGTLATPNITYWLDQWAERNNCTDMKEETSVNGTVHHFTWTCGGVEGVMQHWKVDDMGHVWASKEPTFSQIANDEKPTAIEGNELILDFFGEWTRSKPQGEEPSPTETSGPGTTITGIAPGETSAQGGGNAGGRVERPIWGMGVVVGVAVVLGWGWLFNLS